MRNKIENRSRDAIEITCDMLATFTGMLPAPLYVSFGMKGKIDPEASAVLDCTLICSSFPAGVGALMTQISTSCTKHDLGR